ncbi:unnamed protein product [Pedinophyceae sp. YPF-701]|nr:unnamed protein product [Pedinophyceae sp. YPF-701]
MKIGAFEPPGPEQRSFLLRMGALVGAVATTLTAMVPMSHCPSLKDAGSLAAFARAWFGMYSIADSALDLVLLVWVLMCSREIIAYIAADAAAGAQDASARGSAREAAAGQYSPLPHYVLDESDTRSHESEQDRFARTTRLARLAAAVLDYATLTALCIKVMVAAIVGGLEDPLQHPPSYVAPGWVIGSAFLVAASSVCGAAWVRAQLAEATAVVAAAGSGADEESGAEAEGEGEKKGKRTAMDTIRGMAAMSRPDVWILLTAFVFGTLSAVGQALIPMFTGQVIDYASIEPDRGAFSRTLLWLLGTALLSAVFAGARGGLFSLCVYRLQVRVRKSLFHAVMRQEIGWFDVTRTGDITSRLSADTTTMADQVGLNLNIFMRSLVQALLVLGFMLHSSWRLSVLTFNMIPITYVLSRVYGHFLHKLSKRTQEELANANSIAEEAIATMTTVRSFAAESVVEAAYGRSLAAFFRISEQEALAYSLYAVMFTFLPALVTTATLAYGGALVLRGHLSAGMLVSFMLFQQTLSSNFQAMGDVFSGLAGAVGAAEKVFEMIARDPKEPPPGNAQPEHLAGDIELRDVTLRYPARPESTALSHMSLRIKAGETVALVGPSGGGKSSIVKLLQRYYVPQEGSVLFDGRDVGEYCPKWLKRRVAMVGQEPVLYARTIKENILFGLEGDECPSQEEVEEAARLANAHEFIQRMPKGYDSDCGEKGVQLSGGQKQRIAIARALVRAPRVLLLDEATSALDTESETIVQEALDRLMRRAGVTVVVIAHRLSTVQDADRIVVVRDGEMVEQGTHESLVAKGGAYSRLVRKQLQRNAASTLSLASAAGDSGHGGGVGSPQG